LVVVVNIQGDPPVFCYRLHAHGHQVAVEFPNRPVEPALGQETLEGGDGDRPEDGEDGHGDDQFHQCEAPVIGSADTQEYLSLLKILT